MKQINKIIHISDIHIKTFQRHDEVREILDNFLMDVKSHIDEDDTIILISGDIFDNKLNISNESIIFLSKFIKQLDELCTTLIFAGNHDFVQSNITRTDSITPIFEMSGFKRTHYLDKETGYKSGIIDFSENVSFVLFSCFDNFNRPNVEKIKEEYPNKLYISLAHAPVKGSRTDMGFTMDRGIDVSIFKNTDFVLLGDIHKRQLIQQKEGPNLYYPGSLYQLNFGESLYKGFSVITLPNFDIEFVEVENPYKFYKFEINDIEDIINNKEILKNR